MKKILIASLIALLSVNTFAQPDKERMDRDLKVAESALSSLLLSDRSGFFGNKFIESNYLDGLGVIFTVDGSLLSRKGFSSQYTVIRPNAGSENNRDSDKRERIVINGENVDQEELQEEVKNSIKDFLVDYAILIRQLEPNEKVIVKINNRNNPFPVFVGEVANVPASVNIRGLANKENAQSTYEISSSTLQKISKGQISREKALEDIKFTEGEDVELPKDISVFINIFGTLYSVSSSEDFWLSGRVNYDYIPEVGLMIDQRFYSSRPLGFKEESQELHDMPTQNLSRIPQSDRDKRVKELYPEFVKGLKENILDYGRTMRSLKESNLIIIKASMTKCSGCDIPKEIELTLKVKIIEEYNEGKISRDKALAAFKLEEIGAQ